jgi:TRAP-type C4-dicarboxylate transport system permease small subunit
MQKFFDRLENIFIVLGISSLFLMVCLTTVDTGGRYLFNSPLPGSYEVTEKYLMIFAVFFGLCFAYCDGAHIRLTFITDRLRPGKLKLVFNYVAQWVSVLFNMFLLAAAIKLGLEGYKEIWDATKFKLPMWPAYLVMVVGLLVAVIWMTADLWQVRKGKSCLFKEEESKKVEESAVI